MIPLLSVGENKSATHLLEDSDSGKAVDRPDGGFEVRCTLTIPNEGVT
jgi:hypothetical protein